MAKSSSQKFIARNRAPRVQFEYDVESYGSEKKVQVPLVMGVMAELTSNPLEPIEAVTDRNALDIDVHDFDDGRLKSMKPRVAFSVPNLLTREGGLDLDIAFMPWVCRSDEDGPIGTGEKPALVQVAA